MKGFRGSRVRGFGLIALLVALAGAAPAQEVGTVASLEGSADIGRGGIWTPAAIGSPIHLGDELRTARPGRLRVVFQDDSVLTVSDDSRVTVTEQVFDPEKGKARSLMDLVQGKVTAIVSEYYRRPDSAYEIKTVTAVAGVRGTEFVIKYDPLAELTEVVGVSGHIEVHSVLDPTGPGVLVTANETTTVAHGQLPTSPRRIEDRLFRQQLEGVDFIGGGHAESLVLASSPSAGANLPPSDRAASAGLVTPGAPPVQGNLGAKGDAVSLIGQPPSAVQSLTGQLGIGFPR